MKEALIMSLAAAFVSELQYELPTSPPGPGYSFQPTATLLREFDGNVERVNGVLRNVKPADWELGWNVRAGDQVYSSASRKDAIRNTINHLVHHRGQLTVYLRELDVPIPQLYGPTADEK